MSGNWWDSVWWLEFLEGETEPSMKNDLEVLLKNSSADREILESWQKLKIAIKSSDEVALPENGWVYERLHERIMDAVEQDWSTQEERASGDWDPLLAALTQKMAVSEEVK